MNNSLIHADIFFFVTTIAVVIFTIGSCIALYYFIRISKRIKDISEHVQREVLETLHDVKDARHAVREEATKIKGIVDFFLSMAQRPLSKPKAKKATKVKIHNEG